MAQTQVCPSLPDVYWGLESCPGERSLRLINTWWHPGAQANLFSITEAESVLSQSSVISGPENSINKTLSYTTGQPEKKAPILSKE